MSGVTIIGCGFVADLYMRSLQVSGIPVLGAYDLNTNRLAAFCHHWGVARCDTLEAVLQAQPRDGVVLNLTNPSAHYDVNKAFMKLKRSHLMGAHGVEIQAPWPLAHQSAYDLHETTRSEAVADALGEVHSTRSARADRTSYCREQQSDS